MHTEYLVNYILVKTKKVHDEANHVDHEPQSESGGRPAVVVEVGAIRKRTGELD